MDNTKEIFGCFVSGPTVDYEWSQALKDTASKKGALLREYVWGSKGIDNEIKTLKHKDYGKDIELILLKFYANPMPFEQAELKNIENYDKKDKSIGINIFVTDDNFFNQQNEKRDLFFKESIFGRLILLSEIIKKKKLDLNIELLKKDFLSCL